MADASNRDDFVQEISEAIEEKSIDEIIRLKEQKTDFNFTEEESCDLARRAILTGEPGVVEAAGRIGVNFNAANKDGDTPMHGVITYCQHIDDYTMFGAVIRAGGNLEIRNKMGRTPVFNAVQPSNRWTYAPPGIKALADAGADFGVVDIDGTTLPLAAGMPEAIEAVATTGADFRATNKYGYNPAKSARWRKDPEVIQSVDNVLTRQRAADGVTPEQERQAEKALERMQKLELPGGSKVLVIELEHNEVTAVTDRLDLYGEQDKQNALIISSRKDGKKQITYLGPRGITNELERHFPDGTNETIGLEEYDPDKSCGDFRVTVENADNIKDLVISRNQERAEKSRAAFPSDSDGLADRGM